MLLYTIWFQPQNFNLLEAAATGSCMLIRDGFRIYLGLTQARGISWNQILAFRAEEERACAGREEGEDWIGLGFFWGGTEHPPIPMGYQQIINGLSMDYHPLMDHPFPMDYDG